MTSTPKGALRIFIVAGETSGDILGARLMQALRVLHPNVEFQGVGGEAMRAQGLVSQFPMSDIAVMGLVPVIKRLPMLLERIRQTALMCELSRPDALVIIDSPDFTHRVARRVRKAAPDIPIVNYVSPTVWAWREGRAARMRAYIDHVMAVLPFEPAAHARLGGPPCTYVGHPLVERLDVLRPNAAEQSVRDTKRRILVLPGSRVSEVTRLLPVFGETAARIRAAVPQAEFVLPVAPHVADRVAAGVAGWAVRPELVRGEEDKHAAFRAARAALAASGTVTLELGLSQIPMVTAYRVSRIEQRIVQALVKVSTPILPSLILGRRIVPEFLQEAANPDTLTRAILPLIEGGRERDAQLQDFQALDRAMQVAGGSPSMAAARIVAGYAARAA